MISKTTYPDLKQADAFVKLHNEYFAPRYLSSEG
jgi:hypothetical protein